MVIKPSELNLGNCVNFWLTPSLRIMEAKVIKVGSDYARVSKSSMFYMLHNDTATKYNLEIVGCPVR